MSKVNEQSWPFRDWPSLKNERGLPRKSALAIPNRLKFIGKEQPSGSLYEGEDHKRRHHNKDRSNQVVHQATNR
jgi:hypothetical protein